MVRAWWDELSGQRAADFLATGPQGRKARLIRPANKTVHTLVLAKLASENTVSGGGRDSAKVVVIVQAPCAKGNRIVWQIARCHHTRLAWIPSAARLAVPEFY
jgi:hypothetical protein